MSSSCLTVKATNIAGNARNLRLCVQGNVVAFPGCSALDVRPFTHVSSRRMPAASHVPSNPTHATTAHHSLLHSTFTTACSSNRLPRRKLKARKTAKRRPRLGRLTTQADLPGGVLPRLGAGGPINPPRRGDQERMELDHRGFLRGGMMCCLQGPQKAQDRHGCLSKAFFHRRYLYGWYCMVLASLLSPFFVCNSARERVCLATSFDLQSIWNIWSPKIRETSVTSCDGRRRPGMRLRATQNISARRMRAKLVKGDVDCIADWPLCCIYFCCWNVAKGETLAAFRVNSIITFSSRGLSCAARRTRFDISSPPPPPLL